MHATKITDGQSCNGHMVGDNLQALRERDRKRSASLEPDGISHTRIVSSKAESIGTQVVQFPGGPTSVFQPCDVGINKPLKTRMTENCKE